MPLSADLKGLPLLEPSFFVTLPRLSVTSLFCTHTHTHTHQAMLLVDVLLFSFCVYIKFSFLSVYIRLGCRLEAYSYIDAEQCR